VQRLRECLMMAIVEYDGTEYLGFQIQRTGRTIQGEIERALAELTQRPTRIVAAGRTDTGVHAKGQVIHFTVAWRHPWPELHRALNAVLPVDIAVVHLRQAPTGFHARYSARSREYVYTIDNGAVRSPLAARYAYHCAKSLDTGAMNRACVCLVGEHDFLPFGWSPRGEGQHRGRSSVGRGHVPSSVGRGTVRTVHRAGCRREGDFIYFEIEANAFLRRMVRRIVGNLLLVGSGDLSPEDFAELLSLKHRRTPGVAAPGHGLCLVKVNY
jgi:tRNA pseudouridine38-40 synthase